MNYRVILRRTTNTGHRSGTYIYLMILHE